MNFETDIIVQKIGIKYGISAGSFVMIITQNTDRIAYYNIHTVRNHWTSVIIGIYSLTFCIMLEAMDKELLPMKIHYFLFNAATAPIVPFLPLIVKQLGFSATFVGTMYMALPISGLVAKPLFGRLADKFGLHKILFLSFQALVAISFFSINFIPKVERHASVTLVCDGQAFLEICPSTQFTRMAVDGVLSETSYVSNCPVSCEPSANLHRELCNNWNATDFCKYTDTNLSTVKTRLQFTASFNMSQNLQEKKCVYVRVSRATFRDGSPHTPACESQLKVNCSAMCHDNFALQQLLRQAPAGTSEKPTYQFYVLLLASVLSWIGMAVVVSIADALCFDALGNERRKDYGKQRMWGSIGFGIFGIGTGYLVDVLSRGQAEDDYTCVFYIMLIAMILDIAVSATLKKKNPDRSVNESTLWDVLTAATTARMLVFAWWCIGAGMCTGVVWNFLFWYIEDLVGKTQHRNWLKTLQGLLTGIQCFLGELPFNFISGSVLRKLGHVNVMSLVLLIYAIRFMSYSVVSNPWTFLLLEVLHGPSLGLCWPTMASYGDKATASGSRATVQGFVGAVFEGIGVASGSLLCGRLMDSYGGVVTFRAFSAGALLWLSAFWVLHLMLRKAKAYPIHQGHNHLASYAPPDDAILMTINSQELQTY